MSPLIQAAVIGPLRHAPGRTALLVLTIALGVALGLAVYLINRSAADEMALAARSLYGVADLAIADAAGLDEELYPRVARLRGVAAVSPVVEVEAKLAGRRGALKLLGVDAFRSTALQPAFAALAGSGPGRAGASLDPRAVLLSASAARELELEAGAPLEVQIGLQVEQLQVAGVLPAAALAEHAGVIDIATAQWRFGKLGKLSRINLRLAPGTPIARVRAELTQLLPATASVTTPGQAGDEAVRLSRAYRSNLGALALVALFTGGFFVYSTQALATLRRRRELAILHALGVTRRQQCWLMLCGAALVGACGALLGSALGVAAATLGLAALGGDLGAGYFRGLTADLEIHPLEVVVFIALGIVVAVLGALRPALDAARVPTAHALKSGDIRSDELSTHGRAALAFGMLAAATLLLPPVSGLPLPGYVAIALLLIGIIAAMPSLVRVLLGSAPPLKAVTYQMAIAQIGGTARYATLSISATIVSFSLMVAMAIMVTSFRTSLGQWMQKLLPADVYLRVGYVGESAHLDESAAQAIAALPGIERMEASRYTQVQLAGAHAPVTLIARTLDPRGMEQTLWLTGTATVSPRAGIAVWVNEAAADLLGLRPGTAFSLPLGARTHTAVVRGVWRDYEHQSGAIVLERETYLRLTGDHALNTLWLWLDGSVGLEEVRTALRGVLPADAGYELRAPAELRRLSLAAFDRTFAVTYLLELVAVIIGLFGIATGISAQVLARRGELGALRHLGLTRAQIGSMLALEGLVLGVVGVAVGLVSGAGVGLILVRVVNRQSFHWSMDLFIPGGLLAVLSAALIVAAAVIAVVAGRQAMSTQSVAAVKEDW